MSLTPEDKREIDRLIADRLEAESIADKFTSATEAQREEIAHAIATFMSGRQASRRRPENVYTPRWTQDMADVNTSVENSTTVSDQRGHKGPTLPRWIDQVGGHSWLDPDDPQIVHFRGGGGGADCMFDYLVSNCWTGTEGQTMPTASGCTYKLYSTISGAMTDIDALAASDDSTVYICPGTYAENVSIPATSGGAVHLIGAGEQNTIIAPTGGTKAIETPTDAAGMNISIREMTVDCSTIAGSGNYAIFCNSTQLLSLHRLFINTGLSDIGLWMGAGATSGGILASQCRFVGSGDGAKSGSGQNPRARFEQCIFASTLTIGVNFGGGSAAYGAVVNCLFDAPPIGINLNFFQQGVITGNTFTGCADGIKITGSTVKQVTISANTFYNCTDGIDMSGMITSPAHPAEMITIMGNTFETTSTDVGIRGHATMLQYDLIIGNVFNGYTAGNELINVSGTGVQVAHNTTDSGTPLTDTGLGHAGSGTGMAAPNSEPFVTIGNSANLSAERALTAGPGIAITDGGANSTVTVDAMRTATIYVASNDATTAEKNAADYLCDNTADDVQITAALAALNTAGGGRLVLSSGTFTVNAAGITLYNNIKIEGQGRYATEILLANSQAGANRQIITDTTSLSNITIEGITFDGNKANQTDGADRNVHPLLNLGAKTNLIIRDCAFENCYAGAALRLISSCTHVLIDSCFFTGNGKATPTAGFECDNIYDGSCTDVMVRNSVLLSCTDTGVATDNGTFVTITGNYIDGGAASQCIAVAPSSSGDSNYVTISNNVLYDSVTASATKGINISDFGSTNDIQRVVIANNQIVAVNSAIYLGKTTGGTIDNVVIIGNLIESTASGTCIDIAGVSDDVLITGNKVGGLSAGATSVAINFTAGHTATNYQIIGNDLTNSTTKINGTIPSNATVFGNKGYTTHNLVSGDTLQVRGGGDLEMYSDDGSTLVGEWDGATGFMGIGGASDTTVGLTIAPTFTDPAAARYGTYINPTFRHTGASSANHLGAYVVPQLTIAAAATLSASRHAMISGWLIDDEGLGGTVSDVAAWAPLIATTGTVTVTAARAIHVHDAAVTGGSIGTYYGIDIPALAAATTNIGIRNLSTSRLVGGVTIGSDAAVSTGVELEVVGQQRNQGDLTFDGIAAPGTPAADDLVVYNETATDLLKAKDDNGAVYALTHKHLINVMLDGTVTTQKALVGPMPHAGTITDVTSKTCDGVTIGATAAVMNIYKILAANINTDGGTTSIFTVAPTITNGNMRQAYGAPDLTTTFAAGDYFAFANTTVGTNATFIQMGMTVRYT